MTVFLATSRPGQGNASLAGGSESENNETKGKNEIRIKIHLLTVFLAASQPSQGNASSAARSKSENPETKGMDKICKGIDY